MTLQYLRPCPYCDFEVWTFADEIRHMTTRHPDVVAERLQRIGEDVTADQIRSTAGPDFPPSEAQA